MSNQTIDDELSVAHLEPGCDENPLEAELEYNPLRYCYEITAVTEAGPAQVFVRFALQEHKALDTIEFTNAGQKCIIPFFPRMPECGLEPLQYGLSAETEKGYQVGENPYYLVPTVVKVVHKGASLTRDAAAYLITPDVLVEAISAYQHKIEEDPNAPAGLLDLLGHWDPNQEWAMSTVDDEEEEEEEEEKWEPDDEEWEDEEDEDEDDYEEDE
jgi:hypothetical protein